MENFQEDQLSNVGIQVDQEVKQQLYDACKWTKFISVLIFVVCALVLLLGVLASSYILQALDRTAYGTALGGLNSGLFVGILIFVIILVGVVYYFLFNFSTKVKAALMSEDVEVFNSGLRSLKTFFRITAILGILSLLSSIRTLMGS